MSEVDIDDLMRANVRLYTTIGKFECNLKKTGKVRITKGFLEARLSMLSDYWKTFEHTHQKIMNGIDETEEATTDYCVQNVYDNVADLYLSATTFINEKMDDICSTTSTRSTSDALTEVNNTISEPSTSVPRIKLPAITIPKFDGNYQAWPAFYDLFRSLVHDDTRIAAVHKLHYLKSSLTGEPEHLLRRFQVTNLNYDPAWEMLTQRYQNKHMLVNTILKTLFNQPRMNHESAQGIKSLMDTTVECVHSMTSLGIDTSSWDAILNYIVVNRLTPETHLLWEQGLENSSDIPKFSELKEFLETRHRALEMVSPKSISQHNLIRNNNSNGNRKSQSFHTSASNTGFTCSLCSQGHNIRQCEQFTNLSLPSRFKIISSKKLCSNCLSSSHLCAKCPSKHRCMKCKKRHHTLLHTTDDNNQASQSVKSTVESTPSTSSKVNPFSQVNSSSEINSFHAKGIYQSSNILLATAMVRVNSDNGRYIYLRALLDQGSQSSFITESASQRLGLRKEKVKVTISGIGDGQTISNSKVRLEINAHFQQKLNLVLNAFVLRSLTRMLPSSDLHVSHWSHISGLTLADPEFATSSTIDLVLGADVYAEILLDGVRRGPSGTPTAQKTQLGWILSGNSVDISPPKCINIVSMCSRIHLEDQLKKFWELEEISTKRLLTDEESYCESLYEETFTRNSDGRCVVKLPFKQNLQASKSLGSSKQIALTRFLQTERSLRAKPDYAAQYITCLNEYIDLNHMEPVPKSEENVMFRNRTNRADSFSHCYLPHHGVLKESSSTTKLRVVFDASQPTGSGISLNDTLLTGPRLQDDLISILTRWRKFKIAITADIEKMYRQVLVTKDDADYQRILWRDKVNSEVQTYRLLTLTFGTSSAPYLAVKTIQHIAKLEQAIYPLAAQTIFSNFYVDDLLSGADEVSDAVEMQRQLVELLQGAGFKLCKWSSNSSTFLNGIPTEHQETKFPMAIDGDKNIKTLGLYWHPVNDVFQFRTAMIPMSEKLTKRRILSDVAKLFDPSGWLAPVTITAKIILQSLWLTGLDWDDTLPESITQTWTNYRTQLPSIEQISISRWIGTTAKSKSIQLHTFCDASQQAYAAVVYLRVVNEKGEISIHLLAAKTKVAPIKPISLARLELCGAVLASRLVDRMQQDLQLPDAELFAWTDATIVLAWLKGHPHRWTTFIANRVTEIHQTIRNSAWNHVNGADNPADCASRGIIPESLQHHPLWWKGPKWLSEIESSWPTQPQIQSTALELRKVFSTQALVTTAEQPNDEWFNRFSTWTTLVRCTAYCLRFIHNSKNKTSKLNGYLSTTELHDSKQCILKRVQQLEFPEWKILSNNKQLTTASKLLNLTPFVDHNKLLRVGGRLQQSSLHYDAKHQILLPKSHHVTTIIVNYYHQITQHGGPQITLNVIRQHYWIPDARNTIRLILNKCLLCYRHKATVHHQLMGQLPASRITSHRPFLHTGVDYAGPIDIKFNKGRGAKCYKAYIALFVCLSVKAIHLELVTDLTSTGFIAAYRRFTARRGLCSDIYSDCGTNFIGAAKMLKQEFDLYKIEQEMAESLANDGCHWHFIPPGSPNFGGLWEAGVKSMKTHLKRAVGNSMLTYEELSTCLHQIEAVLNSRPLCPISTNPDDLNVLTPGHFLIGEPMVTPPEPNLLVVSSGKLSKWQTIQQQFQSFWKRWHLEYLSNLQQRPKWLMENRPLQVNDLVLIKDDRMPPSKWLLGRVIETTPGPDNIVRVASIRTKNGVIVRSMSKICILPLEKLHV